MNKRERQMYENYCNSKYTMLTQVYANPSAAKQAACWRARELMYELNGRDFRICSRNTFTFSIGFIYELNGKKTLHYRTGYNAYNIFLE